MSRFLWHSNAPWGPTGYSQQTAVFCDLLAGDGYDVAISAFWGLSGKKLDWGGMPVYPSGPDYGDTWLPFYAADWGGAECQVITLQDIWKLENPNLSLLNIAHWCPVDHDPLPPIVKATFDRTHGTPIAMSKFGREKMEEAGLEGVLYSPHGIDTDKFRPHPQAEIREAVGLPADAFIVGMVANNVGNAPPRKAYPQVFEAFAAFAKKHDDAHLYVHCEAVNLVNGMNLPVLAEVVGVPDGRLRFTPPLALQLGIPQERMGELYSCFDVLVAPSYGEGFGIPIVEAQSCGVPVIVNNWTAMPELCGDGWLVDGEPWYDMSQGSYFKHARTSDILDALEQAYERRGGGSVKAREFALEYDARAVYDKHWRGEIIPALEQRMAERGTAKVVPNRQARRRKARTKNAA